MPGTGKFFSTLFSKFFMSCTYSITTKLPTSILETLEREGATVLRDCPKMPMYMLGLDGDENATKAYMNFLEKQNDVDPLLFPAFGPPLNPFVNQATQNEVFYLLSCFRNKLKADILALPNHVPQPIPANFAPPPGNGYQYHNAQIAINRLQQEIANPQVYANVCPNLVLVPPGNVICDLTIGYANCHIMRRIRKD